ncbi:unnamed protein product [Cuscuta epithymum]|uniref:Transposase-associated domain-containing protein n=1 Tax=Cuscuta epithymum TaxID=186058 RepID=A0AAV0DMX8_9ASTE|nr:unnamed protein product [Cuscuta epithymum]
MHKCTSIGAHVSPSIRIKMDLRNERLWMYNRVKPGRKGLTDEFKVGVDQFVNFACAQVTFVKNGVIRCPCTKCRNQCYKNPKDVKVDLYKWGFESNYWHSTCHGEEVPFFTQSVNDVSHMGGEGNTMYDNFEMSSTPTHQNGEFEGPHESAQKFYELLDSARQPVWSGCSTDTELSFTLKMMSIKSSYNIAQKAMDEMLDACSRAMPLPNKRILNWNNANFAVSHVTKKVQKPVKSSSEKDALLTSNSKTSKVICIAELS